MKDIRFVWDEQKAKSNFKKHGVSFDEATTVFDDDAARLIFDPDHSEDEDRFIPLGLSCSLRILVVVHCYRNDNHLIRFISARNATKKEKTQYKEYLS